MRAITAICLSGAVLGGCGVEPKQRQPINHARPAYVGVPCQSIVAERTPPTLDIECPPGARLVVRTSRPFFGACTQHDRSPHAKSSCSGITTYVTKSRSEQRWCMRGRSRHGPFRIGTRNAGVLIAGQFWEGRPIGEWTYWDRFGAIRKVVAYGQRMLVTVTCSAGSERAAQSLLVDCELPIRRVIAQVSTGLDVDWTKLLERVPKRCHRLVNALERSGVDVDSPHAVP